jgi:hypothetical protein
MKTVIKNSAQGPCLQPKGSAEGSSPPIKNRNSKIKILQKRPFSKHFKVFQNKKYAPDSRIKESRRTNRGEPKAQPLRVSKAF